MSASPWYNYDNFNIFIYEEDILDKTDLYTFEPIGKRFSDVCCYLYYDDDNIINTELNCYKEKIELLYKKLINIKKLDIENFIYIPDVTFPPNLEHLTFGIVDDIDLDPNPYKHFNIDILSEIENIKFPINIKSINIYCNLNILSKIKFPDSLNKFAYRNYDISYDTNMIPSNLQKTVHNITFNIKSLNESFYTLPLHITELELELKELGIENIIWPMNLKILTLTINSEMNTTVGILPYGLEEFNFKCKNYNCMFVEFPPTLNTFEFNNSNKIYKYSENLLLLLDNIKYLTFYYKSMPNISRLPDHCKTFKYIKCPHIILDFLDAKYPNVNIYIESN